MISEQNNVASSIGKLLQARGYNVTIQKFDPYINIDPGTLNPYEHGECYAFPNEEATPPVTKIYFVSPTAITVFKIVYLVVFL